MTNCEQEHINQDSLTSNQTPEEQAIELTKKYLNETNHNLLVLEVTQTVDWEHAIVTNGDNGLIVEVPLILMDNLETSFEKIRDLKSFHRLFFVSQDNSFRLFHLIITTSNKKFDNNSSTFNYYNLQQDFSGYTMILDANNEVTNLYKYNKGKKLTIKDIELTKKEAVFCTYFGWWTCSTSTDICSFQSLYLVGCSNLYGGEDYGTGGGYHGGFGGGPIDDNPKDEPENKELNNITINYLNTIKIDPEDELECFNANNPAKLTVYIQQPRENSDQVVGPNEVGHAFIGIEQNGIIRLMGFYPESGANSFMVGVGEDYDSELRDNYNYLYHVSISKDITANELNSIINYIEDYPKVYNVNDYACTDFVIEIGNLAGMELPSTTVNEMLFSGRSPGQLGQEIRAMQNNQNTPNDITITTTSTNSPAKQGTCN